MKCNYVNRKLHWIVINKMNEGLKKEQKKSTDRNPSWDFFPVN